jgi:DNA-binding NarL/FixJ family response regulator
VASDATYTGGGPHRDTGRAKILLADDHKIVAEGLGLLLQSAFDLVGTVEDGRALVEVANRLRPDIIVTDIAMPLLNGLDAVRQIRREGIGSKVIFLTMHSEPHLATQAFRAGAAGYLLKHSAGEELITAIHEVLRGRTYLTPIIAKDVIALLLRAKTRADESAPLLTPRQREVLQLIAEGRTMKEIAGILHISTRTGESHKYDMMQTLGVTTTAELIRFAIRLGLISVETDLSN